MDFSEVFIPGGLPTYTYNPRNGYELETRIMQAKRNLCKLLIVTGQTKMGKTVLAEKIYERGNGSVWVDGGAVSDVEREMTGRVKMFEIPAWSEEELTEIADRGFGELKVSVPAEIKKRMAKEAMGSPHLMQEFCRKICEENLTERKITRRVKLSEKIADISYNEGASTPVIDWDKEENILTVTDPFFAFYLRWCSV